MTIELSDAILGAAAVPILLVALDFDGTLAPTVDDPATARALPASAEAISRLSAMPSTVVALVSGRSLEGLRLVADVADEIILVGSHGAESRVMGNESTPELTLDERTLLDELCAAIERVAAGFAGARVERKPSGCGLHTRLSSAADAESARRAALDAVQGLEGGHHVSERYGKDILEFTVRPADKGSALAWLRDLSSASAILFIGDDVTDEDGFRALAEGDVGVKVGPGDTAARFRVDSPAEVGELLARLADERQKAPAETSRTT